MKQEVIDLPAEVSFPDPVSMGPVRKGKGEE